LVARDSSVTHSLARDACPAPAQDDRRSLLRGKPSPHAVEDLVGDRIVQAAELNGALLADDPGGRNPLPGSREELDVQTTGAQPVLHPVVFVAARREESRPLVR
jgi:hypothetical protein